MIDVGLLPLEPEKLRMGGPDGWVTVSRAKEYAIANVEYHSEKLRAGVAEWKRVAGAQAELHAEAEDRVGRLEGALRAIREHTGEHNTHMAASAALRDMSAEESIGGHVQDEGRELSTREGDWVSAEDVRKLVREIDIALNGEGGAAEQASLCDIAAQVTQYARLHGPLFSTFQAIGSSGK